MYATPRSWLRTRTDGGEDTRRATVRTTSIGHRRRRQPGGRAAPTGAQPVDENATAMSTTSA